MVRKAVSVKIFNKNWKFICRWIRVQQLTRVNSLGSCNFMVSVLGLQFKSKLTDFASRARKIVLMTLWSHLFLEIFICIEVHCWND